MNETRDSSISEETNSQSTESNQSVSEDINIASLLKAGGHFGHKTSNWNPKMAPFLYGTRNDIYVFNLEKTLEYWSAARTVLVNTAARGGEILLVGTKTQCKEVVKREGIRCGCMYVDNKWVGGTLTNLPTIKTTITKMKKMKDFLAKVNEPDSVLSLTKREKILMEKDVAKLEKQFGGIANIRKLPDLVFILDIEKHHLAVKEARTMNIPIVAIVDSNTDPDLVDYVIPANDDSIGSLNLFLTNIADAVLEGKGYYEKLLAERQLEVVVQQEIQQELQQESNNILEKSLDTEPKQEGPKVEKRRLKKKRIKPERPFTKRQVCEGVMVYTEEAFDKENKPK